MAIHYISQLLEDILLTPKIKGELSITCREHTLNKFAHRVTVFDDAFHSRITVALKYEELTEDVRESIWKTLLGAAGITNIPTNPLKKFGLNGRQIKNCILLAQGLAKSDNTVVKASHVEKTIKICMEFQKELLENKDMDD
jgi:hypothetical protein